MNPRNMRRTGLALLTFIVLTGSVVVMDRVGVLDPVRDGLSQLTSPVSQAFYRVADRPDEPAETQDRIDELAAERDELIAENAQLRSEIDQLEQSVEHQEIRDARPDITFVSANVIGRDPTGSEMFITIDRGSSDDVQVGMAIVDPVFFVGQVTSVTESTARVQLIVDVNAAVGSRLLEDGQDGMVYGRWQSGGRLIMEHVSPSADPQPEAWVVTTSLTNQVPPDIPIGWVVGEPEVNPQNDQLMVEVQPAAEFDALDTVMIAIPDAD